MSETPPPTRYFLPAEQALLPSITDHLLKLGDDLRHCLVIVPTAHSGRRLRRQLAQSAGKAILAPLVQTPESAFRPSADSAAAPKLLWWAAWAEVLKVADKSQLSPLFPKFDELTRDAFWAQNTARQFTQLKDEIAEIDAGFAHLAKFSEEPERWNALEQLDQQAINRLRHWGSYCPAESKRNTAVHWSAPDSCKRIILAAVPDAVPLSIRAWRNALGELPIDVLIHANAELADHFDEWGRPLPEMWKTAKIPFPENDHQWLKLSAVPNDAAAQCIESCQGLNNDEVALGMIDSEFSAATEDAFSEAGWPSYDPDGQRISTLGIWNVLHSLRQLIATPNNFAHVPELIKSPEAIKLLFLKSPFTCARDIDRLANDALPRSLSSAIDSAKARRNKPYHQALINGLEELNKLISQARPGHADKWLATIFERLEMASTFPEELKSAFPDALDALAQLLRHNPNYPVTDAMDLVLAQLESTRIANERSGTAIDQLGWLELAYENASHLRLVGMHEGFVPDQPTENGFLTERLRRALGLRDRAQREARDTYLLSSFLKCRINRGSVRAFISQTDAGGNTRQPSRLLLRCATDQLSARVQHCFKEKLDENRRVPSYQRGEWHLNFPDQILAYKPEENWTLSPSLLKSYLRCPLRFYLERQLGFRRTEFDKHELDAMDFGNLIHDVMEDYGRDPQLRELSTIEEIQIAYQDLLSDRFNRQFSHNQNLALSIQLESMRRRLNNFAVAQASAYQDGWRIEAVELAIGPGNDEEYWEFAGQPVKMRIDRIDKHIESGQRRLIDYKSGKANSPEDAHIENLKTDENPAFIYGEPLAPKSSHARSQRRWKDLQLPLYAEYARQKWDEVPEIGYANLPPAASDTELSIWDDYSDLHDNALEWINGAVENIRNGNFKERPQADSTKMWDAFTALAPDSLTEAFNLAD